MAYVMHLQSKKENINRTAAISHEKLLDYLARLSGDALEVHKALSSVISGKAVSFTQLGNDRKLTFTLRNKIDLKV